MSSSVIMANIGNAGGKRSKPIFEIGIVPLGTAVLSLPLFGLVSCVILSLLYDFESSTATHCNVANYLPSVSSAIGGYTPQRYIWRVCIALHCSPRFIALVCYYNSFHRLQVQTCQYLYHFLVTLNMLLNVIENFCLLLLTCISSTENYNAHETSFVTFLVCSEFYMFFSLILCWWSKSSEMASKEWFSFKMKCLFFFVNLMSCAGVAYFFNRHNTYCEPGVYSLFALSEYTVVISNILFHGMAVVDFGGGKITYVDGSMQLLAKSL